jgi:hypothetical protein
MFKPSLNKTFLRKYLDTSSAEDFCPKIGDAERCLLFEDFSKIKPCGYQASLSSQA